MPRRVSVSSAEFIRNIGHWQNQALRQPVSITHHGRERLVLATPDEFAGGAASADVDALTSDADAVLEHLEQGFLAFDAALRVKRINAAAEAFIGSSRETVVGAGADELPAPMDAALYERLRRVTRTRKTEDFEAAVGSRHFLMRVFPMTEGPAVLFLSTTEAHEQRMAVGVGAALRAATDLHPHAAAVTLNVRGRVEEIHQGFCDWLGFQRDELIGQSLFEMASPDESRRAAEALEKALNYGAPQQIAVRLQGKDGREVRGTLTLAAIRIDVMSTGVVGVMVPIETLIQQAKARQAGG